MNRPKIIAEIAQGYEGRPDYCDFYVRAAAESGADAVKFQIVYADDVAEPGYQYYDWYKKLEMPVDVWRGVKARAEQVGVRFLANLSGDRAAAIAEAVKPHGITIHATNFFNRPLIRRAFETSDQVFVYLGGIEAEEAVCFREEAKAWGVLDRLVLMYGFQAEPTPVEKSQLGRIPQLRRILPGVELGYLDHTAGDSADTIHVSLLAMALGVQWIEKHLTLNRFMKVEDYVSALEPREFATYVETLERLSQAFGSVDTMLSDEERRYRDKAVKKLVAVRDLPAGITLEVGQLAFRRTPRVQPFEGFHDPAAVVGRRLTRALRGGDPILAGDIQ
jgi:sialic acid synthase SpsE